MQQVSVIMLTIKDSKELEDSQEDKLKSPG